MTAGDAFRLLLLSAIWGASFLFMRIAVPEFGPFLLILVRVGGAALVLLPILLRPANRKHLAGIKGALVVQGFLNSAFPFVLLAWAAYSLEAGFMSLLNAATPICAAVVGFLWLRLPLTRPQVVGLILGVAGIAILTGDKLSFRSGGSGWAVLAVVAATFSYGVATHFAKLKLAHVPSRVVTAGSLLGSTLLLIPLTIPFLPDEVPGTTALVSAVVLAVVCTAVAFLLFFDLLTRTGATAATTVTFIIPVFGVLWGALFLQETVTVRMLAGMAVALFGTALVTRLLPRKPKPAP